MSQISSYKVCAPGTQVESAHKSGFPIKMMTGLQVFLVKEILAHCWVSPDFWGFFLGIGKMLWKITGNVFVLSHFSKNLIFWFSSQRRPPPSPQTALMSRLDISSKFPVIYATSRCWYGFQILFLPVLPPACSLFWTLLPVCPISKYKPRLFLESSIYPANFLEWYL